MKSARATVSAYYVECPHCSAPLMDPATGSYLIDRDSVDAFARQEPTPTAKGLVVVTCYDCRNRFALPAAVSRLAQ